MKRIFTIARVKNESDIIESFCRYNLTYCDGMLINDNGSSDNTKIIIEKLIGEGLPIYYMNTNSKGEMSQISINEYGADLIVPLDADEFLYHTDGINPRDVLESLRENVEYQIPWRTFVYEKEPDIKLGFMPNNFTHYRNPLLECHNKVLISNFLIKEKRASFAPGAHYLIYQKEHPDSISIENPPKLVYAHFPLRSKKQLMNKTIPGWIYKWKTPFPLREGLGFQIGLIYDDLRENGEISHENIVQHSIKYSVPECSLGKIMREIKDRISIEGKMDVSFCRDKLHLRYTDYKDTDKTFLRSTLTEFEATLASLPKREWETIRLLERAQNENKVLIELNHALSLQILKTISLFVRNAESEKKNIVIWGAGQGGIKAFKLLEHHGVKIHAFLDSSPEKIGTNINNMPVFSPEILNTDPLWSHSHCAVFIASMAHVQISQQLEESGWRDGIHFYTINPNILTTVDVP